jgi:hypothetical protein
VNMGEGYAIRVSNVVNMGEGYAVWPTSDGYI